MALVRNKSFPTRRQAVEFLLRDQHILLRPEVADWFSYTRICFSGSELEEKSRKLIAKQVRNSFPRDADWFPKREYIVVPYYKFVTSGLPYYYDFTLNLYLAASVEVEWTKHDQDYSASCVVIELIKKDVEKFKLPLHFLEAVSKNDLNQFKQMERDNLGYYTWHIPSHNLDVKLHGFLLKCLEKAFRGKPLGPALVYYGLANWEEGKMAEQSLIMSPSTKGVLVSKEAPIYKRIEARSS